MNATQFYKAVRHVCDAAFHTASLPVLRDVSIKASVADQTLTLTATNLDVAVQAVIPYPVEQNALAQPNARALKKLAQKLKGEIAVSFEPAETLSGMDDLILIQEDTQIRVKTQSLKDEFPLCDPYITETKCTLDQAAFKRAVTQVLPAVGTDDNRPILQCIQIAPNDEGGVQFVTADGFVLHRSVIDGEMRPLAPDKIIPVEGFVAAANLCSEGKIRLGTYEAYNRALFVLSSHAITWRVIVTMLEGTFPHWPSIVPSSYLFECSIDRKRLLEATVLTNEVAKIGDKYAMQVGLFPDSLCIYAATVDNEIETVLPAYDVSLQDLERSQEVKESMSQFFAPNVTDAAWIIAAKPQFVIDALKVCTSASVTLKGNFHTNPMTIQDGQFFAVLMPATMRSLRD